MSVHDLHPEDLLDREAQGVLTERERTMLDAHLSHCTACRFERQVRADFGDELALDAPDVLAGRRHHDGSLLVRHAMATADAKKSSRPPAPAPLPAPRAPRVPGKIRAAFLVAAMVTLASVAGAARWTAWAGRLGFAPAGSSAEEVGPAAERERAKPLPVVVRQEAPAQDVAAPAEAPIAVALPSPALTLVSAPRTVAAPVPSAALAAGVLPKASAKPAAPAPPTPLVTDNLAPAAIPNVDAASAKALFSAANAARVRSDRAGAVRLYRELLERHPGSPEANATFVALGRLLLDQGDATAALPQFGAYLRSGDAALREEAMVGRARAFGALGERGAEARAWSDLVDAYPQSVHAARARARLEELVSR